jgi:hypothetical protein
MINILKLAIIVQFIVMMNVYDGICQNNSSTSTISSLLKKEEIDTFWADMSRAVKEGDFEGYKSNCSAKAVLVSTMTENKKTEQMQTTFKRWEKGFEETKNGKRKDEVLFRFSQRIGNENTAHEIGIFHFTSKDKHGKILVEDFIHFESLLIKENNKWLILMEFQKSKASQKEWEALM